MSMDADFTRSLFFGNKPTFIILPRLNNLDEQLADQLNKKLSKYDDLDLKVRIVTQDIYNSTKMDQYFKDKRVAQIVSFSDSDLLTGRRTSKIELRKFPSEEKIKTSKTSEKGKEIKAPKEEEQEEKEVRGPKAEKRKTAAREEMKMQTGEETTQQRRRLRLPEQYVQHFEQFGVDQGINFTDKANPSDSINVPKEDREGLDEASYAKLAEEVQLVFEQVNPIEEKTKKEHKEAEGARGFAKESARPEFVRGAQQQKAAPKPRQEREAAESLIQQSRADEKHRRDHAARVREQDKKREREDIKNDELKREIRKEEVNKVEKRAKPKS